MNTNRLGYLLGVLAIGALYLIACSNSPPTASPTPVETATIVALSISAGASPIEHGLHPPLASTAVPPSITPIPSPNVALGQSTSATPPTPATLDALIEATGTLGSCDFRLELADNVAEQGHGLMHRASMPMDQGMLFVFDLEDELNFWMKNTTITTFG